MELRDKFFNKNFCFYCIVKSGNGPPKPGKDETEYTFDTIRFPDFHDPEKERWPFLSDPILEKIRKHGKHYQVDFRSKINTT